MPLQTVKTVLVADTAVAALVGARVSPVEIEQGEAYPCVTLSVVSVDPVNVLTGWAGLDQCRVEVTAWAFTYALAEQVSDACRAALQLAGFLCELRDGDQFSPEKEPGAYHVQFQIMVWI